MIKQQQQQKQQSIMDETKEHLKQLIDFFGGSFMASRLSSSDVDQQYSDSSSISYGNGGADQQQIESSQTLTIKTQASTSILRQDINLIIKTLELWFVIL